VNKDMYCDFSVWPYDFEHVLRVALSRRLLALYSDETVH